MELVMLLVGLVCGIGIGYHLRGLGSGREWVDVNRQGFQPRTQAAEPRLPDGTQPVSGVQPPPPPPTQSDTTTHCGACGVRWRYHRAGRCPRWCEHDWNGPPG